MESCLPIASCDALLLDMMRVLRHPFLHGLGFFFEHPNEGKRAVGPPEWDVNLFNVRVGGRGVCGDVAVQGLFPSSASVCVCVCVCASVCLSRLVWWLVGGRVSGQGPDQTIQESEIYKK